MFSLINSVLGLKPKRKVNKKKKVVKKPKRGGKSIKKRKLKRKVTRGGSKKGLKMSKYSPSQKYDYVLFYSDGCPHCVVFKDRLNLIKNKVDCKMGMIDAWDSKNEKIVNKHNIMGVPTLMDGNFSTIAIPTNDNDLIRLLSQ
jgi:thiol-disulfide isomerase/thioredoxin